MKKMLVIILSAAFAVGANAALPQPDLLAQIHFAGAQKISAEGNAAAFTNEFCSAEALALRAETAVKLSVWLAGWLQKNTGANVADGPARLRPLLDDLQRSEWFLEARVAANGKPEVALAVKLADGPAQLWRANLQPFLPGASFKIAGGWLVIDDGPAAPQLGDRLAQKLSAPPVGWLSVDMNWPRLAQWFPQAKTLDLPETQLIATANAANLDITGRFLFAENLKLSPEPWRLPTNTIHPPFVSFTAVRGFSSWLQSRAWMLPYELAPVPDQLITWALPQLPFQTFAAIPVPSATNALAQAYARLKPEVEKNTWLAPFKLVLSNNVATLRGAPFIAPYLQATPEAAGQFLLAGGFPNTPLAKPLPEELLARLAQKNILFYHTESTPDRMPEVLQLSQLSLLLTRHKQLGGNSAALKWLRKVAQKPGINVTEIKQTGPAEMTLVRQSPSGFTAMELFMLASWLDVNNFPGCDLQLPPSALRQNGAQPPGVMPKPVPTH